MPIAHTVVRRYWHIRTAVPLQISYPRRHKHAALGIYDGMVDLEALLRVMYDVGAEGL